MFSISSCTLDRDLDSIDSSKSALEYLSTTLPIFFESLANYIDPKILITFIIYKNSLRDLGNIALKYVQ